MINWLREQAATVESAPLQVPSLLILIKMTQLLSLGTRLMSACTFAVGLLHGNNPSSSRREHPCCTTTSSSGHGTNRQTQPSLALALTSLLMAKLILVLWVVQSASTSGGQRCAAPREVGGTNDVTVSNRVNLVDPVSIVNLVRDIALQWRTVLSLSIRG